MSAGRGTGCQSFVRRGACGRSLDRVGCVCVVVVGCSVRWLFRLWPGCSGVRVFGSVCRLVCCVSGLLVVRVDGVSFSSVVRGRVFGVCITWKGASVAEKFGARSYVVGERNVGW